MKNILPGWPLALVVVLFLHTPHAACSQDKLDFQWITLGTSITHITTGVRFSHQGWYAEGSLGGLRAVENRESSFFLGLNLGRTFPLNSWLLAGFDVGGRHIIPDGSDNPASDTGQFFSLDARIKLEAILNRHMSVFLGGGATSIYQGYSLGSDTVSKSVFFLGVGLL